jgi:hypothetical protein
MIGQLGHRLFDSPADDQFVNFFNLGPTDPQYVAVPRQNSFPKFAGDKRQPKAVVPMRLDPLDRVGHIICLSGGLGVQFIGVQPENVRNQLARDFAVVEPHFKLQRAFVE